MPATTTAAKLTGSDRKVLAALKATAWITNNALKARHGWTLTGAQRCKLNAAGLVTSRKVGRQFEHILAVEEAPVSKPTDLASRITDTVTSLLAERNRNRVNPASYLSLVALRAALADVDRWMQDAALMALFRARRVGLIPEDNRKALTAEHHAAAIEIGGEDKHLIRIKDED
jgi:hypothetical protein